MAKTPEQYEQEMMDKYNKSLQNTTDGPKISSIVCPKHFANTCNLCELTYEYFRARLGKEHVLRQKALDLNRKLRYFSSIVLPSDPTTPIIFEYGEFIFKILFGHATDPNSEYKGYTHPTMGRNFYIKKTIPPGANKRQTTYQVEMRVQQTPLLDMSIVQRLPDLETTLELVESGKIKILHQSELPDGRTEMRMLPSWLGPTYTRFYVEIPYHYINKDEFEAIQSGKVNPYESAKLSPSPPPVKKDAVILDQVPTGGTGGWGDWNSQSKPPLQNPVLQEKKQKPFCFGSYDANSPLCNVRCAETHKAVDECKVESTSGQLDQNKALREKAAKLFR
jgi:hypothetical protein